MAGVTGLFGGSGHGHPEPGGHGAVDADEPVEVKVVTPGQMADNVKIRPLSQGILYNKVGEHALTFRLERPAS